jgi:hypothetical protein
MSTLYVIGILLSLILIFQKDAEAGQLCAPTQDFPKVLNESYKEHVTLRGLSLKGHILFQAGRLVSLTLAQATNL